MTNNNNLSPQDLAKSFSEFFKRDLVAIPLIKKHPLATISQRCGLKAATLELDTSTFPNIEYVAGTRLGVYPPNSQEHVKFVLKFCKDDFGTNSRLSKAQSASQNDSLYKWTQRFGKDSLRMALTYVYDINMPPSRDLLKCVSENCSNKDHKLRLASICKSDDSWEKWVCQSLRTLRSTLEEFNSCQPISARFLLNELSFQQPRLYSISSIKSSKRFRADIMVFQHKFSRQHISTNLLFSKERDKIQQLDLGGGVNRPLPAMKKAATLAAKQPNLQHQQQTTEVSTSEESRSNKSIRSLRSMAEVGTSPISTHQVQRVPTFSGPLMSLYASSSNLGSGMDVKQGSLASWQNNSSTPNEQQSSSTPAYTFDGLCSNYLLNLQPGDHIICEFVENPRFTLKGNRERPIMMIGQDIGVVAFRPFWQQRSLEYDRAQVFYTLFKDLSPKKFGDMQLVCLVGNKCKIEDLFKRELNSVLTNKVLSSLSYINKNQLMLLLKGAASAKVKIEQKELIDLGNRIAKLLIESNGCLYTCCDPQMTQAIEILAIESIAKNYSSNGLSRKEIMSLLPKWKGRRANELTTLKGPNNQYVFTLENPFERALIVQEIYDHSI